MTARQPTGDLECPSCKHRFSAVMSDTLEIACPQCGTVVASGKDSTSQSIPPGTQVRRPSIAEVPETRSYHTVPRNRSTFTGKIIGRYLVKEELGRGGFGVVLLALDTQSQQDVALKLPNVEAFQGRAEASLASFNQSFVSESQIVSQLRHPHIVSILEINFDESLRLPYLVMEYLSGGTLESYTLSGKPRLDWRTAVAYVSQMATALSYLHQGNYVHRDLKPTNVLLTGNGEVKIADFGLALHETNQPDLEGEHAGTVPYMSPEQLNREIHLIDGRSDQWSLGVILYELLTQAKPFRGNRRQVLQAIQEGRFRTLAEREPTLPIKLDEICRRCLSPHPRDRYSSMAEVQRELKTTLKKPWWKSAVTLAVTSSLLLLALATGAIAYDRANSPAHQPLQQLVKPDTELGLPHRNYAKRFVWPYQELGHSLTVGNPFAIDPSEGNTIIKTASLALLELGRVTPTLDRNKKTQLPSTWELDFKIQRPGIYGYGGMYFACRVDPNPPARYLEYSSGKRWALQCIGLRATPTSVPDRDSPGEDVDDNMIFRAERRMLYIPDPIDGNTDGPVESDVEVLSKEPIIKDSQGIYLFKVVMTGGFIAEVYCNGVALPELSDVLKPKYKWAANQGSIGIYNLHESTTVRDIHIRFSK
ncbi:MAG: protein kinase domain-containing protein [Planctomycetota bacterium]